MADRLPFLAARFCLLVYIVTVTIGAFVGGLWAALGIGLALVLFTALWIADKKPPLPHARFAFFTCGVLGILAAELPFSAYPDLSMHEWLRLASIFLPLMLLTAPRMRDVCYMPAFTPVIAVAAGIGALALGCELQSGGMLLHNIKNAAAPLTQYNRGIAHLVILAFPLGAGLWQTGRKKTALTLAVVLLYPASLTESHTAKLALIAGLAVAFAVFHCPRIMRVLLAGSAVAVMGWPFYAQWFFLAAGDATKSWHNSWRHRLEIWDYLSYRIAERPLLGWGLGTTHKLDFAQPHGNLYLYATANAPHAHNFVTQLWVETGLPGIGCGLAFALIALDHACRAPVALRPFALGCWTAALTVSLFGFDFWTDALWAAFALSAFVFGMLQQQLEGEKNLVHV